MKPPWPPADSAARRLRPSPTRSLPYVAARPECCRRTVPLAARVLALANQIESDPAAQEPLAREAYRLRRLTQEVAAGLAERRLAEIPAAPSPTRRWCG